jgi:PAS domain S-box-containing protein
MHNRILALLEKWTESTLPADKDELTHWQDRIAFSFLLIGVVLGFIVLIFSVRLAIKENLWIVVVVDIVLYAWVVFLFFKRSLPRIFRVTSIVALCYILGLTLVLVIGPFGGAGPTWLFFFPIITGLLSNVRYSLLSLLVNILTLVAIGLSVHFGWYHWPYYPEHSMEKWLVLGSNFIFLNAIATLGTTLVIRGLRKSLQDKKQTLGALAEKNRLLHDNNLRLLDEMQERKKAEILLSQSEEALQESKLRFEELVGLLPIAYLFFDKNNRLVFANKKARKMFNIAEEDFHSITDWNSISRIKESDRSRFSSNIKKVLRGKEIGWISYTAFTNQGVEFPIEVFSSTVIKNEKLLGYQGLAVDITDRVDKENLKKAKEIAEQANQAISEWLDFIAHELRNPVAGITGYADIGLIQSQNPLINNEIKKFSNDLTHYQDISKDSIHPIIAKFEQFTQTLTTKEKKLESFFQTILSSALRLDRLLNELLDYSKLEAKSMTFQMDPINLTDVVKEARLEMEILLQEKNQTIELSAPQNLPKIECDLFRIGQVFRNLFTNAIKFSHDGGKIMVTIIPTTMKAGERDIGNSIPAFHAIVADNGVGIPEDQMQDVFEKFKQSRKTRSGEGTGLGLPICKQIIESHSGRIWVKSEEEKGTQFHLLLPIEQ